MGTGRVRKESPSSEKKEPKCRKGGAFPSPSERRGCERIRWDMEAR
jgi:hypothetical protein